jgi:hypothetical protein
MYFNDLERTNPLFSDVTVTSVAWVKAEKKRVRRLTVVAEAVTARSRRRPGRAAPRC